MTDPDWREILRDDLDRLEQSHLYRRRRVVRPIDATHVEIDGLAYVNFASNNYLGLTHHPRVIDAVSQSLHRDGFGSGAAALISGYSTVHADAEAALARWKGTEASVLLTSGYLANVAAVQTLASLGGATFKTLAADANGGAPAPRERPGFPENHPAMKVRFLIDRLCHASLIDAVRQSGRPFEICPHNDMHSLRRLLETADPSEVQVVLTESIFSMDGDSVDLPGLVELKSRYGFVLLLDEAHGSGVYGPGGSGFAAECGLQAHVDVTIVTLSKALGGIGAAVCGSELFCNALINRARPYVFATALPPASAAGAIAAIDVLQNEPQRQERVRKLARTVREEIQRWGIELPAGDSPIIPIILGSEVAAIEGAAVLQRSGLLVLPIRPPTVPKGTSRLRLTLSSDHTDEEVSRLLGTLRGLGVTART